MTRRPRHTAPLVKESNKTGRMRRRRQPELGVTAVLVAICLAMLGAFVSASLNIGKMMWGYNQLQNATDSGALAGAVTFDGTRPGVINAILEAERFAELHPTGARSVEVDAGTDIQVGVWTPNGGFQPKPIPATDADARVINAIRVQSFRRGEDGMPMVFASFLRDPDEGNLMHLNAHSIGIGGGPCDVCSFPIAVPSCQVINEVTGDLDCTRHFIFSPDGEDTAGFTSLSLASTSTKTIGDALDPSYCAEVSPGDYINVANGNNLVPLKDDFNQYIGQEITVPIIEANRGADGECEPKFNQNNLVIGFATMKFIEAVVDGAEKVVEIEFVCNRDEPGAGSGGGCGQLFGTTSPVVNLVD